MIKSLFVATLLSILIEAQKYELLVQQDSEQCYFDTTTIRSTGNQGTPSDPCYSNIGTIAQIKDDYRDANGKFSFRLTYYDQMYAGKGKPPKDDPIYAPKDIVSVWSQTSWITESTIVGADLSQVPNWYNSDSPFYFHGLGLSKSMGSIGFLDGLGGEDGWGTIVLQWQAFANGIPGFNRAMAKGNKLEILAPEKDCVLNTNEICIEIELNTDKIDTANDRIDTIDDALNTQIDTLSSTLNGRIDSVESTLNDRIDSANGRIDTLRDYLQGTDAAHAFNGDIIRDNKSIPGDLFEFSKTELLLLGLNLITIVFGLFICWKGGLFSKNNKRGYAKVSQYYESDAVEKPINA